LDGVTSVPEDLDPVVWHIASVSAFDVSVLNISSYPASGGTQGGNFGFADVAKTLFRFWQAGDYNLGGSTVHSAGGAPNPFNSKSDGLPLPYMRFSAQLNAGLKGWSTQMRWTGTARTTFADTADNRNWICVSSVWLPWDGTTVPTN
jgi:hypothetical protein